MRHKADVRGHWSSTMELIHRYVMGRGGPGMTRERSAPSPALSAETISAIRTAGVAAFRRTATLSRTTSRLALAGNRSGRSSSRTTIAAKSASLSAGGRTRRPFRAKRRQLVNWVSCAPYLRAIPRTVAPVSSVSATIRAFSSSGQRRRPPRTGSTSTFLRVSIEVSI